MSISDTSRCFATTPLIILLLPSGIDTALQLGQCLREISSSVLNVSVISASSFKFKFLRILCIIFNSRKLRTLMTKYRLHTYANIYIEMSIKSEVISDDLFERFSISPYKIELGSESLFARAYSTSIMLYHDPLVIKTYFWSSPTVANQTNQLKHMIL